MMKKNAMLRSVSAVLAALTILILVTVSGLGLQNVLADEPMMISEDVAALARGGASVEKSYINDDAGIFTADEIAKLEKLCKKASKDCRCDVVIVTTELGYDAKVLESYVRQIISSKYGYQEYASNSDAIVFAIDMKSRVVNVVTSGNAKTDISQSTLEDIRVDASEQLTAGNYYKAGKKYVAGVNSAMSRNLVFRLTKGIWIKLGISLVVAIVVVLILMSGAKAKMTVDGHTYAGNDVKIRRRQDRYIRTVVHTRKIQRNSSSGGGGGNSGSSSGTF